MEQQHRRRGQAPQEKKVKKEKRKFNASKILYFIPFVIIVISGLLFKSVFPLLETIVVIAMTILFAASYGMSYYGATGRVKFLRGLFTFINIILMLIALVVGYFSFQVRMGLSDIAGGTPEVESKSVNVNKDSFNVLISGTDTRDDQIDSPSRSDVIMVATVNPKSGEVLMTSLPRDTYTQLTCTGTYDKLTHASGYDMSCLIDTVESILDIEINYYIKANFFAVINLIDAVGGIDVEVDQYFCGQDENDVEDAYCFTPGMMHMDGAQALSYARERHSFSDGDYTRAMHQQQVMSAFMLKVMKNPGSINDLIEVSASSMRTNMTSSELMSLAGTLTTVESEGYVIQGTGTTVDIPEQGLYGTSVQVLNEASIAEAQTKIAEVAGN